MEFILINENKMKIVMSAQEMKRYELDENEFHLSLINTRKILSQILHNSPTKTGFENTHPNEKILLQLYPEKHGGCELYVTKLTIENNDNNKEDNSVAVNEGHLLPISDKNTQKEKKPLLCYCFEELSDIIILCRALNERNFKCRSSLYFGDDDKYYMIFSNMGLEERSVSSLAMISEFGELTNAEHSNLWFYERGKSICEDSAIEILSEL